MTDYFFVSSEWAIEPYSSVLVSCMVFGIILGELGIITGS